MCMTLSVRKYRGRSISQEIVPAKAGAGLRSLSFAFIYLPFPFMNNIMFALASLRVSLKAAFQQLRDVMVVGR